MADASKYLCVVRNDGYVPDIVHKTVLPATPENFDALTNHARELAERSKLPFTVVEIDHRPLAKEELSPEDKLDRAVWIARRLANLTELRKQLAIAYGNESGDRYGALDTILYSKSDVEMADLRRELMEMG